MSQGDLLTLAEGWVRYWRAGEDSGERNSLDWVTDRERHLVRKEPDSAWFLILEVLRIDSSTEILEVLAAGPLEDLLAKHGPYVIDRVENEARSSPKFAELLGGVWKNAMTAEVWDRVQAVWDRRGWDGNAA